MKPFTSIATVLLVVVAAAHVLRILFGWQVTAADRLIPMWVSAVAAILTGVLALLVWRENRRH